MGALSKLAPLPVTLLKPFSHTLGPLRQSHAALFRKRPGQLIVNRIKDHFHFYFFGLGIFPVLALVTYAQVFYGPCQLTDIPKDGPTPHYWQYERTPLRQWWAKYFGVSDIEHHERNLAYYEKQGLVARWRQIEQRVKHLEGERLDYKGWSYQPVSATWIDMGRWQALRLRDQYEQHGHYAQ